MTVIRKRFHITVLGFAMLCNTPAAVHAQDVSGQFQVPDGCAAYLTVQSRSCTVSHYWQCDADPEGTHWRVTLDEEGAFYLNFSDAEFRWLRAFNLRGGAQDTLIEPEPDPASISELLEAGRDSYTFSIRSERPDGVFQRDYSGFDALTGATVTIDGEDLEVTEFTYQWQADGGLRTTEGTQFVSRSLNLFFGGLETVTTPTGEVFEGNYSPVEFTRAGEPGFLATQPLYDCGDLMSGLTLPWAEQG